MIENRTQIVYDYLRENAGVDLHINDVVAALFADEVDEEGEERARERTSSALSRVSLDNEAVIRVERGVYRYEPRMASDSGHALYELIGPLDEERVVLRDERGNLSIWRRA